MSWLQRIWFWIRKISNMVFMNRKKSTFACCRLRGLCPRLGLTKLTTHCHSMNSSHLSLTTEELNPRRQISLTHLGGLGTSQRIFRITAHSFYCLLPINWKQFYVVRNFDTENTGKISREMFVQILKTKEVPEKDINDMISGEWLRIK